MNSHFYSTKGGSLRPGKSYRTDVDRSNARLAVSLGCEGVPTDRQTDKYAYRVASFLENSSLWRPRPVAQNDNWLPTDPPT